VEPAKTAPRAAALQGDQLYATNSVLPESRATRASHADNSVLRESRSASASHATKSVLPESRATRASHADNSVLRESRSASASHATKAFCQRAEQPALLTQPIASCERTRQPALLTRPTALWSKRAANSAYAAGALLERPAALNTAGAL
jgi:hypothetical protein